MPQKKMIIKLLEEINIGSDQLKIMIQNKFIIHKKDNVTLFLNWDQEWLLVSNQYFFVVIAIT